MSDLQSEAHHRVLRSRHNDVVLPYPHERWWFACYYPERPPDCWVVWAWDCDACTLSLIAAAANAPEHPTHEYLTLFGDDAKPDRIVTVTETLRAVREWRAETGRRPL